MGGGPVSILLFYDSSDKGVGEGAVARGGRRPCHEIILSVWMTVSPPLFPPLVVLTIHPFCPPNTYSRATLYPPLLTEDTPYYTSHRDRDSESHIKTVTRQDGELTHIKCNSYTECMKDLESISRTTHTYRGIRIEYNMF